MHGFPDAPAAWHPVMRLLAREGFRVLAPFMPGYGPSRGCAPYDIDSLADRLACFVRTHTDEATLVGHDWGAAVVHQLCMRHPGCVRAAATLSVPHPIRFLQNTLRSPAQWVRSSYMLAFQMPGVGALLSRSVLRQMWRTWSPGHEPDDAYLALVLDAIGDGVEPLEYYRRMFMPLDEFRARVRGAEQSPVRMLYLHGEDDGCIAPSIADGQERYYPQGLRTVRIPSAGHFLPQEVPDDIVSHLLAFL